MEKIKKFLVQSWVSIVHFREVKVLENFTDVASAVNGRVIRDAEVFASFLALESGLVTMAGTPLLIERIPE